MSFIDALLGRPSAPASGPQTPGAPAGVDPAFYQRLLASANAGVSAQAPLSGRGLFNLITGNDRTKAVADVNAAAPSLWQQFQAAQNTLQAQQLGNAQRFAATDAMTGTTVDPSNPMASIPALASAYSGTVGTPATGAPAGQPGAAPAPGDMLQQRRAFYQRMGSLSQMMGDTQGATEFFKLANTGIPDGTAVLPTGQVADAANGQPVTTDVGTLLAKRAGQVATADQAPRTAGQIKVAGNQAVLDRETTREKDQDQARYETVSGFDKSTGQPVTTSRADLVAGRSPNFVQGDNPFFARQQEELKDLRTKSESADQGLDLAQQITNAANGVFTGQGAGTLQDVRKFALAASALTGEKPSDAILDDASKFEQLKFAAQQLVAVASHNLSPRVAMNIYNQIASVKPGDASSAKGLRDIIINQIVPSLQRDKAIYSGTSAYYKSHPTASDAGTVVPGQNPLENFHVKDVHSARPGDFFIDPQSGNLRQRAAQ